MVLIIVHVKVSTKYCIISTAQYRAQNQINNTLTIILKYLIKSKINYCFRTSSLDKSLSLHTIFYIKNTSPGEK